MKTNDLFTLKESKTYPGLYVKKYKHKVFYDALWNAELIESRGHVFNAEGERVIAPFTKIFNRGEKGIDGVSTDINLTEECLVVNKVNGFMAAATYVPEVDEVVISTTGSLDSDYVEYAKAYITEDIRDFIKYVYDLEMAATKFSAVVTGLVTPITFLFEIVHPDDPHIIEEDPGAYLIGFRSIYSEVSYEMPTESSYFSSKLKEQDLDSLAKRIKCNRPKWYMTTFEEAVERNKTDTHEGVVVYGQTSGKVLKLKTPYYLAAKACARIKKIGNLNMRRLDEEFYPLIEYLKQVKAFDDKPEQERLTIIREYYRL